MQLRKTKAKTGKRLLKLYLVELMSNVFIDGKKFLTPLSLRDLGLRKKTEWYFT
jgi:hypothetical protein